MHSQIYLKDTLADHQDTIATLSGTHTLPTLSAFVDARGLACPLPLLKAKLALKAINDGEYIYLVSTNPNSITDITRFCQKNAHLIEDWQSNTTDTTFHFIITKNSSV